MDHVPAKNYSDAVSARMVFYNAPGICIGVLKRPITLQLRGAINPARQSCTASSRSLEQASLLVLFRPCNVSDDGALVALVERREGRETDACLREQPAERATGGGRSRPVAMGRSTVVAPCAAAATGDIGTTVDLGRGRRD